MNATEQLARRLRELRRETWPGKRITQRDLAAAVGASPPLISSWESGKVVPPVERLAAYARFFATEKSVAKRPFRVVGEAWLTGEELLRRDDLLRELTSLRDGVQQPEGTPTIDPFAGSRWRFPADQDITIVCWALPGDHLERMPYTDSEAPDYVDLYRYADLDALLELYGYLRAVNPMNSVQIRTADRVRPGDYTTHLMLLGGVDWNTITAGFHYRLDPPVRQLPHDDEGEAGAFVVGRELRFAPMMRTIDGKERLVEDVAYFGRTVSPLNEKRTVTICSGVYQRGTFAAVRALTDPRFRDRNGEHVRSRFGGEPALRIISRAKVLQGTTVTPDWTYDDDVLHEWPERTA